MVVIIFEKFCDNQATSLIRLHQGVIIGVNSHMIKKRDSADGCHDMGALHRGIK